MGQMILKLLGPAGKQNILVSVSHCWVHDEKSILTKVYVFSTWKCAGGVEFDMTVQNTVAKIRNQIYFLLAVFSRRPFNVFSSSINFVQLKKVKR
jgi:hypothetical protein